MSGPKVYRIATVEEILDYCRGLLAQLDAAVASWRGKVGRLGLAGEAEIAAMLQRRDAIRALATMQGEQYLLLYKQVPSEIAFLAEDIDKRIAAAAEKKAQEHTTRRRLASTASTLAAALARSGASVPSELQAALSAARDGARDGVEAAERALSQGFALLAPAGEDPAFGARQREIARRLGEGEETRTLADWLQGQPPADDARGQELDRHIAELEAREGEPAARPYAERAQRLAAEASPGRRQLLADSLLIELAARASARRETEKSLSTLTCLVAELEQLAGGAEKALIDRAQDAVHRQDGQAAKDLVAVVRAAIDRARSAAAAAARRKAVLEGLSALGYEVREGMETAWASNGNVVLRSAERPDYGVKLSGGAEGRPLQVRAIGFGQPGAQRDAARDRDAEALWCSDFQALKEEIAAAGGSLSVDIAQPAGLIPIEIVQEAAPDSRQDTGRRAPLRQAKR
jgi:hypothetical protein